MGSRHTTFILHGGALRYENEHNAKFFRECARTLEDGDEVLRIEFAREDDAERRRVYERDRRFLMAQTDKKISIAIAERHILMEQAKRAKAFFSTGGRSHALFDTISQYPEFADAMRGKVYAGSSAGACLASTYYFSYSESLGHQGMKWLPMRLMVHFGNAEYNPRTYRFPYSSRTRTTSSS